MRCASAAAVAASFAAAFAAGGADCVVAGPCWIKIPFNVVITIGHSPHVGDSSTTWLNVSIQS
jgi:hypothetical protein